jgi:SAM-dependent methyltransferase
MLEQIRSLGLPAGSRILDVATGPGEPAATIAEALPEVSVVATDVSPDMVQKAQTLVEDKSLTNLVVELADAEDLSQFDSESFDAVTCCYGYMFPEDKAKALEETRRVLKPGGMLVATIWTDLTMLKISRDVMAQVLGTEPPPPPLNPMSLAEEGLFDTLLKDAGFTVRGSVASTYPFNFSSDPELQYKIGTILLREKLDELDAHDVARRAFFGCIPRHSRVVDGEILVEANTFVMTTAEK